jgi:zinc protease
MLAEVLGGSSQTSYLGRRLQFETQEAIYTSAFYGPVSLDDTTFGVFIVPAPGLSLEEAEAALDREIQAFLDAGEVDAEQLERIKMRLRAAQIYENDDTAALARRYGAALTSGLTIDDIEAWPALLQEITAEEIIEAGRKVFDRRRAVTGWLTAPEPDPAAAETAPEAGSPDAAATETEEVTP